MDSKTFEQKIKQEIDQRLYLEPTNETDLDRVMINIEGKLKPIYLCAFPKAGVKEELDSNYVSDRGDVFPNREILEAKIRTKIDNLDLELYD